MNHDFMYLPQKIGSKIALKIGIIIVIQIAFIITSFGILSYYQSQGTHLGNSINIAGKNRFLTSNLMFQLITIDPMFDKLITALRTAVNNDRTLEKEATSYGDIFDAYR